MNSLLQREFALRTPVNTWINFNIQDQRSFSLKSKQFLNYNFFFLVKKKKYPPGMNYEAKNLSLARCAEFFAAAYQPISGNEPTRKQPSSSKDLEWNKKKWIEKSCQRFFYWYERRKENFERHPRWHVWLVSSMSKLSGESISIECMKWRELTFLPFNHSYCLFFTFWICSQKNWEKKFFIRLNEKYIEKKINLN